MLQNYIFMLVFEPKPNLFFSLLIVLLLFPMLYAQNQITTVTLNTELNVTQSADDINYFSVDINSPQNEQILLITASAQISTFISIYLSSTADPSFNNITLPDAINHTHECFYKSVDTCAIQLSQSTQKVTVYFSIELDQSTSYILSIARQNVKSVRVGHKYKVTMAKVDSAVISISGSQFDQKQEISEIVVKCTYRKSNSMGFFQMLASLDQIPDNSNYQIIGQSLTSFNKLLILPAPSNLTSIYYVLLQGVNGTIINLEINPVLLDGIIKMNSSVSYISNNSTTYTYSEPFKVSDFSNDTEQVLPIYVDLYALRGYGVFAVDYCNGLYNFTFQNTNGENGEIIINKGIRFQCLDFLEQDGGLLIENIVVTLQQVYYGFGYEIYLSEGNYEVVLFPGQKQYGVVLQQQEYREFSIINQQSPSNQSIELTAIVQTLTGNLSYVVQSCSKNKSKIQCENITDPLIAKIQDSIQSLNFSCPSLGNCSLVISHASEPVDSEFVVSISFTTAEIYEIFLNTPMTDVVPLNGYKFYFINLTTLRSDKTVNFSNATVLQIRNTIINGDIMILSSIEKEMPVFQDAYKSGSDVKLTWSGLDTYVVNQSSPDCIYLSVYGEAESIYYLQYTLNTSANIPQKYLNIIDDAQNDYMLTNQSPYILLKYTSHIIPFSVKFEPMPDCISFGTTLPLSQQCANQIPTAFHDKVVFYNISQKFYNDQDSFKFSAYANSGDYLLEQDHPALIACLDSCYELVSVMAKTQQVKIIHSGSGNIKEIPNGQQISNDVLTLLCTTPPCAFQLNASLPYGGQMELSYASSGSAEIQWYTKPFSFVNTSHFFMKLPRYSLETSFIFYSEAINLAIFYNVISIDEKLQNTLSYQYPTQFNFDDVEFGDPLRSIQIVPIDEQILNDKGCNDKNSLCIVTVTIYGDPRVQYSLEYIRSGLGYYSSNSFSYQITPNEPIQLKKSYSISYFEYWYKQDSPEGPLYISIEALSNCRPVIQLQSSQKMHYKSTELPTRMPGQYKVEFSVLNSDICRFQTAITTVPYEVVLSNIMYPIEYNYENETQAIFVHHHTFYYSSSQLEIKTSSKVASIMICLLTPDNNIPTTTNNIGIANDTNSLIVDISQEIQTYIISVINNDESNNLNSLMVLNKKIPITLLHNQQFKYSFNNQTETSGSRVNSSSITFKYETASNFLIFVDVSKNTIGISVNVEDAFAIGSTEILSSELTNQSEPWVVVNSYKNQSQSKYNRVNNQLKAYIIKFWLVDPENSGPTGLTLHIEEDGIQGLAKLYNGVSYYDSLLHMDALNCYQYTAPVLTGTQTLTVDIAFTQQQFPHSNSQIIKGRATLFKQTKVLDETFNNLTNSAYRLQANYYSNSTYKICFELVDPIAIGAQYSVVVNVPDMKMIYTNEMVDYYEGKGSYEMYEYINHGSNKQIKLSLTNCLGKSEILASESFNDMLTGKLTEIKPEWQWSVGGVSASIVNISHGYFYVGIKNLLEKQTQLYQMQVRNAPVVNGTAKIIEAMFGINWKVPVQAYALVKDQIEYVGLEIPPIISIGQLNATKIVYSLYLMNLEDPKVQQLSYSINTYSRCPSLLKGFKPLVINQTLSNQYIYFQIPITTFEPESNISIRGQVFIDIPDPEDPSMMATQTVSYYYGYDQILIEYNTSGGTSSVLIIIAIIIFIIIVILLLALAIKTYLNRRRRNTINFQASQFHNAEIQMESKRETKKPESRPQNTNLGYGEFVDEIS